MIGILPTLTPDHLTAESISANPRYALINEQIFAARGEDMHIVIDGPERLAMYADTIAPESACTSVQFHLQVSPQDYASYWNAAQCLAGVQLALGANSPFLFGKELWRETRVALFEQATDTRPPELKAQGVRPRVWFGERWITSIFDQFEENVSLLPGPPAHVRRRGSRRGARARRHAALGGAAHAQRHHLPVEPAGLRRVPGEAAPPGREPGPARRPDRRRHPGQRSLLLRPGAACWPSRNGRSGRRCRSPPPRTTSTPAPGSASTPRCTGRASARCRRRSWCCAICSRWPIRAWPPGGWTARSATGCLGIIERRCTTHQNGAEWQARTFHRIDDDTQPLDRRDSLRRDAAPLRRAHAQQRAGPHLARGLTGDDRPAVNSAPGWAGPLIAGPGASRPR